MPKLDREGTNVFYQVKGKGIPIVFIHPPLLTSANFMFQVEGLSSMYQVITFDIRGHGKSGYSEQAITYPIIVDDIIAILDHLGVQKAFICGYSTGGSIVLEFLLKNADRAWGGIVISAMSEVNDVYLKERISLAVKMTKGKRLPVLSLAITWGNADTREVFKTLYQAASFGDERNIRQYYRYSLHYNCTSQLYKIKLPILLVYGARDTSFHKYAQLLHKKLPYNELVFLEKEKHQIPTKAASKLNEKIKAFISENEKKIT